MCIAENYLGTKVKNAVVTVPAYFNDSQRQVHTHTHSFLPPVALCAGWDHQTLHDEAVVDQVVGLVG